MLEQVHHWRLSSSWAHTSGRQLQSSKSLGRPGRTRFAACTPSSALNDTTTERILSALKLRKLGPLSSSGPLSPAKVNERYRLFLDEWDKGFMEAQEDPEGYYVDCIYGALPPELEGTLFRNGPGKFTVGSSKIDHPYDGDGLVASLAFKDGKAFFRSRFVRTPEYEAEAAAGRILFRGTFATQRPGGSSTNVGDLYVKNTSNTNVCCFGDRLWTLFEAGQPYRLDPFTLETMGIDLLNGALRPGLPFNLGSKQSNSRFAGFARRAQGAGAAALPAELLQAGGDAVTAHPSVDPVTGRLVFFSYRVRPVVPSALGKPPVETELTFWEVEEGSSGDMRAVQRQRLTISGFAFLHDFALTENYYVIFQNPVTVDNGPYLLGHLPAAACVRWVPGAPTLVHLVPRAAAGEDGNTKNFNVQNMEAAEVDVTAQVRTFVAPPLFVFHHANAFEQDTPGGRCVVMDSIHYDSLPAVGREALASQHVDPDAAFTSRLRRVEINLDTGVMRTRTAFDGYLEMPAVNPNSVGKRHTYCYGYHSIFEDPQIGIAKVNVEGGLVEIWKPGPFRFALEPRFIPRRAEDESALGGKQEKEQDDDGWLIAQLFDSKEMSSEVVILDARNLAAGPVAVMALREPLPSALHSCWSDVYYGPDGSPPKDRAVELLAQQEVQPNVVPFTGVDKSRMRGSGEVRKSVRLGRDLN